MKLLKWFASPWTSQSQSPSSAQLDEANFHRNESPFPIPSAHRHQRHRRCETNRWTSSSQSCETRTHDGMRRAQHHYDKSLRQNDPTRRSLAPNHHRFPNEIHLTESKSESKTESEKSIISSGGFESFSFSRLEREVKHEIRSKQQMENRFLSEKEDALDECNSNERGTDMKIRHENVERDMNLSFNPLVRRKEADEKWTVNDDLDLWSPSSSIAFTAVTSCGEGPLKFTLSSHAPPTRRPPPPPSLSPSPCYPRDSSPPLQELLSLTRSVTQSQLMMMSFTSATSGATDTSRVTSRSTRHSRQLPPVRINRRKVQAKTRKVSNSFLRQGGGSGGGERWISSATELLSSSSESESDSESSFSSSGNGTETREYESNESDEEEMIELTVQQSAARSARQHFLSINIHERDVGRQQDFARNSLAETQPPSPAPPDKTLPIHSSSPLSFAAASHRNSYHEADPLSNEKMTMRLMSSSLIGYSSVSCEESPSAAAVFSPEADSGFATTTTSTPQTPPLLAHEMHTSPFNGSNLMMAENDGSHDCVTWRASNHIDEPNNEKRVACGVRRVGSSHDYEKTRLAGLDSPRNLLLLPANGNESWKWFHNHNERQEKFTNEESIFTSASGSNDRHADVVATRSPFSSANGNLRNIFPTSSSPSSTSATQHHFPHLMDGKMQKSIIDEANRFEVNKMHIRPHSPPPLQCRSHGLCAYSHSDSAAHCGSGWATRSFLTPQRLPRCKINTNYASHLTASLTSSYSTRSSRADERNGKETATRQTGDLVSDILAEAEFVRRRFAAERIAFERETVRLSHRLSII